jgi:ribosomal protein S18 acetylase RimI-like enzyme
MRDRTTAEALNTAFFLRYLPVIDYCHVFLRKQAINRVFTPVMIRIRPAQPDDFARILPIIRAVLAAGDTYVFEPDTPEAVLREYWMGKNTLTFVAEDTEGIAGSYVIRPNQPGLGSHVANASFMVHPDKHGKGIGRYMGEHALLEARKAGYQAMQFNIVIATNTGAIALWQKLGFDIIGRLPKVFRHRERGLVDAFVMHRFL